MIGCRKLEQVMQHFCPVVDRWATLVSSPVSLPLVKPFIGQLLRVSFASSLAPKKWQNDHNSETLQLVEDEWT